MAYESVMGKGRIRIASPEKKKDVLKILMAQYHKDGEVYFNPAAIDRTFVYALDVLEVTGKKKSPK